MKRFALTVSSLAVAALALTGCSTAPTEEPTPTVSESATADPNAPRGFSITANGNPIETADGALLVSGSVDGFQFFYAGTSPKVALIAADDSYTCNVQDGMDLAAAAAFAESELSAGTEAFMKEDNGNAFPVVLKDAVSSDEAHRFVEPAKGKGMLISCFGPAGAAMIEASWEWIYANTDVITVDASQEGLFSGPVIEEVVEETPAPEATPSEEATTEEGSEG